MFIAREAPLCRCDGIASSRYLPKPFIPIAISSRFAGLSVSKWLATALDNDVNADKRSPFESLLSVIRSVNLSIVLLISRLSL